MAASEEGTEEGTVELSPAAFVLTGGEEIEFTLEGIDVEEL